MRDCWRLRGSWGVLLPAILWLGGCAGQDPGRRTPQPLIEPRDEGSSSLRLMWDRRAIALPVARWLRAVKKRDPELLSQTFSTGVMAQFRRDGRTWDDLLRHYERKWAKKFGAWKPDDFQFTATVQAEGKENQATVQVTFVPAEGQPRKLEVNVVKEGDEWFVDES